MMLPSQRDHFALPPDITFLNCAYMAPQLRAITAIGVDAVKRKETPWTIGSYEWFGQGEDLRAAVAKLMDGDAEGVAIVPAASYGIAIAAANLPLEAAQNVVVLEHQFPSNVYSWRDLAALRGAELRTARKDAADSWTEAVLDAIDDDTAIVAVPNCHWTDGALVDLVRVGERARSVGAALVVDASQSFGAYPISVKEVQPDFLVSVGYKWQLGPYGIGYLYVAPKWRERARPLEGSWLTRAGADDFSSLVAYVDEYQPGARRFDMGEYSQFVLLPMALAAIRQLLEWDPENIQATVAKLTAFIAREASALGLSVLDADKRVGHMLGIRFPAGLPAGLPRRLADARVHVSVRGDAIRVSPNVYNSEDDAARLIEVLRELA
jgi:selenocysteine lyase/cysteine desulfurase